ncbi:MAG: CRISPR system precrRNA processing endoribonuclease RAMP protein Cas6 [Anaerovoracaceae bacterium]
MIKRLRIFFKRSQFDYDFNVSSLFQGILMEQINTRYAELLHNDGLKPYSQNVQFLGDDVIWEINTLTKEAANQIILPLASKEFRTVEIAQKNLKLFISDKLEYNLSINELMDGTYFSNCDRYTKLEFITPTAFKSNGRYLIMPSSRQVLRSLISKFDTFSSESELTSEELLDDFEKYTDIVNYRLKSAVFHLEGAKVPGFIGQLTIKANGPQQMANLVRMLLEYGKFSGVGIKCAIGMGNMRIINKEGK